MRARSTNILDSTYITPVVQASSKTRAAMLMLAYNAPRKPQMCHNASPPCRPTWSKGCATARPKPPWHAAASAFPCTIGYLLTGHEKIREGYVKRRAHKLHPERAGATTLARATPACALRPTNVPTWLLCRIAARACMLTSPRMSVRSVLQVVADDLLRLRRLTADRAVDGLHERCGVLVTVNLQHDE